MKRTKQIFFPRATEVSVLDLQEYGVVYIPGVLSALASLLILRSSVCNLFHPGGQVQATELR